MKKITTLMCAVALWCSAQAQAPALHFGRDGKFRIAQFTDVHLDLGTPYRRAQAEKTIAQMRYILDAEHPDLVVFSPLPKRGTACWSPSRNATCRFAWCWGTTTPSRI